jgi:Ca2+-binding RTX toxin-like protein
MPTFLATVSGTTPDRASSIKDTVETAGREWASHLTGDVSIEIAVEVKDLAPGVIAEAASALAYKLGDFYQQGVAVELINGWDPNGSDPDAFVFIDPDEWEKADHTHVIQHELGHALGFNGWGGGELRSTYDANVEGNRFTGSAAKAIYGADLPVVGAHYAVDGLMYPAYHPGRPEEISALDVAVLSDTGVPVKAKFGTVDNDEMRLTHGADFVYGGFGNDTMFGNQGTDTLYGWNGDDLLYGGKGDDLLFGGSGDDTLRGDLGDDTLDGGDGADVFVFGPSTGHDVIEHWDYSRDRIRLPEWLDFTVEVDKPGLTVTITFGESQVVLAQTNFWQDSWMA